MDSDVELRVRRSFARQTYMTAIRAELVRVAAGEVDIALPFSDQLAQQDGYLHAGVVAGVADSACGYAALSLLPPGNGILSVEFKLNLMKPATGERFRAAGKVIRAGRTLTVCSGEVHAERDGALTLVALMQATMMGVRDRGGQIG